MTFRKNRIFFLKALLCSLSLMGFSFFIHSPFPVRLISFSALLFPAFVFAREIRSPEQLKKYTGEAGLKGKAGLFLISGIFIGISVAVLYRWYLEISLFPRSFFLFSLAAALIGSMEELVFRGFIQEYVRNVNGIFSVIFSSFSHTGYKCCLFISPFVDHQIDVGFLIFWTFAVGLVSGMLRHFSKSVWPSVLAHALFDILVYAECTAAPWWVW